MISNALSQRLKHARITAHSSQDLSSIVPEVRFFTGFRLTRYALSFNYNVSTLASLLLLLIVVLFEFTRTDTAVARVKLLYLRLLPPRSEHTRR